jgi:2-polyprenyl-6-methoxyphenol hydroxylase-like FAD-dependent oxidoreductase
MAVAACLAQRNWDVTVHERSSEMREIGAGIFLKENSLRVLEELGCLDAVLSHGHRIRHTFINDRPGHDLRRISYGPERVFTILRADIQRDLANAAISWGARFDFNSYVKNVTTAGKLATAAGEQQADLIVGADGIGSIVRAQSGLETGADFLENGSTRVLVPRKEGDTIDTSGEYWRGHKRILVAPVNKEIIYLCASSREDDPRGVAMPLDAAYWSESFPELRDLLYRVVPGTGVHHVHGRIKVSGWQRGRIALVGDSAHGQPPNLGQGAGMAISNAQALAHALDRTPDVEAALKNWEREYMNFTLQVQNWSLGWDHFMHRWPLPLEFLRSKAVIALANFPPTKRHWKRLYRGVQGDDHIAGAPQGSEKYSAGP